MKRYRLAAVFLAAAAETTVRRVRMSVELRRVMIWRMQCPIRQNSK